MSLFRRSLAEDSSDRLAHVWSVAFLLILAFSTWLLPLSPVFNRPVTVPGSEQPQKKQLANNKITIPDFRASCWCPSEFTGSMVAYVNGDCGNRFNNAIKNNNASSDLYDILDSNPIPSPGSRNDFTFKPKPRVTNVQQELTQSTPKSIEKDETQRTTTPPHASFVSVRAPLTLFLLALCLKIPHLLWSLLSSCFSSFSLDMTLTSAVQGQSLDRESRNDFHRDLASSVKTSVNRSPRSLSVPYLLFKLITIVVVVVELVYVGVVVLPDIEQHQTNLNKMASDDQVSDTPSRSSSTNDNLETSYSLEDITGYDGRPLLCDVPIRQLQSLQKFTLQCIFTPRETIFPESITMSAESSERDDPISQPQTVPHSVLLSLHEAVFTAVLTYLVVLAVVTIANTLSWLGRLVFGQCVPEGVDSKLPMDALLLLAMSGENAGPLVTRQMAQNFHKGGQSGPEDEIKLSGDNV